MEQLDHDECRIEVKQELEEDPLAGQLNFDSTLCSVSDPEPDLDPVGFGYFERMGSGSRITV